MAASDNLSQQLKLFKTPPETPSVPVSVRPPVGEPASEVVHGSLEDPAEYMKAPAIHVGDEESAKTMTKSHMFGTRHPEYEDVKKAGIDFDEDDIFDMEEAVDEAVSSKIKPFDFSKHAQFHDVTLTDPEANRAHSLFLQHHKLPVPSSVSSSATDLFSKNTMNEENVQNALQALKQNKILRYENTEDVEFIDHEGEPSLSYVVPSPWMNLRQSLGRDPMEQPVLPMDYSQVNPSEKTRRQREMRRR